jgi:hypothetical protein
VSLKGLVEGQLVEHSVKLDGVRSGSVLVQLVLEGASKAKVQNEVEDGWEEMDEDEVPSDRFLQYKDKQRGPLGALEPALGDLRHKGRELRELVVPALEQAQGDLRDLLGPA